MAGVFTFGLFIVALFFFVAATNAGKILGGILGILGFLAGSSVGVAEGGDASTGAFLFACIGVLLGSLIGGITPLFVDKPRSYDKENNSGK